MTDAPISLFSRQFRGRHKLRAVQVSTFSAVVVKVETVMRSLRKPGKMLLHPCDPEPQCSHPLTKPQAKHIRVKNLNLGAPTPKFKFYTHFGV